VTHRGTLPIADVVCVAAHPDDRTILVGRRGGRRSGFWDLTTGRETDPGLEHPTPVSVTAVAVHPDGRLAATGGQDGSVRIWSIPDGKPVGRLCFHADRVNQMAFGTGPSARVLVTASSDGTARFWDVGTGLPLGPPLRHPEAVLSVAFDRSGERVITGGRNGYAVVWSVPRHRS
jgi:WD40 repeat protein